MANFDKNLNLDIKLPFKFVPRQLFMPFLMSYVSTLYSQYFLGSTLLEGIKLVAAFLLATIVIFYSLLLTFFSRSFCALATS